MKKVSFSIVSALIVLLLAACNAGTASDKTVYALEGLGSFEETVSGGVTFEKLSDTETRITINLEGTPANGSHPAHIHEGDATPGGGIYVTLGTVEGDTGNSVITVTETDAGDPITYEELIAYDGYVNVHLSPDELNVIVAQGETGAGATPIEED